MKEMFKAIGKGIVGLIEFVLAMVIWILAVVMVSAIGLVMALVAVPVLAIITSVKDDVTLSEAFLFEVGELFNYITELCSWINEQV